jgi:hypothetical protein
VRLILHDSATFTTHHRQTNTNNAPQILKDTTLFFSRDTPNLTIVILVIDHRFSSMMSDMSYNPAIRYAIQFAKKTLNKYYSLTDSSEVYQIAMGKSLHLDELQANDLNDFLFSVVLHPHHKLEYFKAQNWEPDWIKTAQTLVREEYDKTYVGRIDPVDHAECQDPIKVCVGIVFSFMVLTWRRRNPRAIFLTTYQCWHHPSEWSAVMN